MCNLLLFCPSPHTSTLLTALANINPLLHDIVARPHLIKQFQINNKHLTTLNESIYQELYTFITTSPQVSQQNLLEKFPYLPNSLITGAFKCLNPILGYTHPNPAPMHLPPQVHNPKYSYSKTHMTIWNIASLNTSLPCIYSFINHTNPAILAIQETKLTTKKSPKYIQSLFPQCKLMFNNTTAPTRYTNTPGIIHELPRGGLLTFIHNKYAYSTNITKIQTPSEISPYLQIIRIQNKPLSLHTILHAHT